MPQSASSGEMTLTVLGRLLLPTDAEATRQAPAYRVVVALASGAARAGIRAFLNADADVRALPAKGDAVLAAVRREPPDVLLLGAETVGPDALEVLARLSAEAPSVRTLLLTDGERPALVMRALATGASGHLDAGEGAEAYRQAVRQATRGERVLSAAVRDALVARTAAPLPEGEERPATLTAREFQVLRLVARGFGTGEIGRDLDVSASTVRTYKAALRSKLGLNGDAALARYAFDHDFA